ncbi:hypothetical protein ACIPPM_03800 [Streptomyces sp. NPDC090119]|uniref:hypothetical protein n=1 Tax=Streptomyces sp. NPDC090119 TaxID=3365951 RepID=UPI00380579E5
MNKLQRLRALELPPELFGDGWRRRRWRSRAARMLSPLLNALGRKHLLQSKCANTGVFESGHGITR